MKIVRFITDVTRKIIKPPPIIIPTSPPLLHAHTPPAVEQEQPEASSSAAPPVPPKPKRKPIKRALLIGIQNVPPEKVPPSATIAKAAKKARRLSQRVTKKLKAQHTRESSVLLGCHRDVKAMRKLLIELYGYEEKDIGVLIDGDDPDDLLPTEENILKKLDEFVADAQPGDTFFFHFSGHSTQEPTEDADEEDGMNEFIVTYDNQKIQDNTLKEKLVDRLPVGSRLTAVFDTCHSASMLDLKHCRCNRVYVPWVNKGKRGSITMWNDVVRKDAIPISPIVTDGWKYPSRRYGGRPRGSSISQRLEASAPQSTTGSGQARPAVKRQSKVIPGPEGIYSPVPLSAIPRDKTLSLKTDTLWLGSFGGESSPIARCASPMELFCQGWCKPEPNHHSKYPVVVSLSAAKDGQRAWEDATGSSMTQTLVTILRGNPNPSLHDLLMDISHELHTKYLDIHAKSRDYKKQMRHYNLKRIAKGGKASEPDPVEMDNFQDPQISSLYPLDTKAELWAP